MMENWVVVSPPFSFSALFKCSSCSRFVSRFKKPIQSHPSVQILTTIFCSFNLKITQSISIKSVLAPSLPLFKSQTEKPKLHENPTHEATAYLFIYPLL